MSTCLRVAAAGPHVVVSRNEGKLRSHHVSFSHIHVAAVSVVSTLCSVVVFVSVLLSDSNIWCLLLFLLSVFFGAHTGSVWKIQRGRQVFYASSAWGEVFRDQRGVWQVQISPGEWVVNYLIASLSTSSECRRAVFQNMSGALSLYVLSFTGL